jgi:hypothetical protein
MRLPRYRWLVAAVGGAVTLLAVGRLRDRRATARRVADLRAAAATRSRRTVTGDDFRGLPDPVARYLRNAVPVGRPRVDEVRLEQTGTLRLGGHSSPWKRFSAVQWCTVDPPGFLWRARVRLAPLLSATVRDLFCACEGTARVSLFGLVPAGGADPGPELNEGELLRYLAEAVWYPTALLPAEGVEWTPVDDTAARATLDCGRATASLVFHFDGDEVARVHAEARPRRVHGDFVPTPWTGHWRDYRRVDGLLVPTAGTVVWHLPDGDLTAWRGRVTSHAARPAP